MDVYRDVVSLENEALAAFKEGDYLKVANLHKRVLTLARQLDNPRLMAVLFNRLGQTLEAWGNVQQAVKAYELGLQALAGEQALDLKQELQSLGSVPKGYDPFADNTVPDLYSEKTARDLETEQAEPTLPVTLLINIGNAYLLQPQVSPALNAYQQALARIETRQAPKLRAYILANVGEILRRQGKNEEAEVSLKEALALFEAHTPPTEKRRALVLLAGIYRDRGEEERALEAYRQALELYADVEDATGEARALSGLGQLYLKLERFDKARVNYARALELALQVQDNDTLWHVYWGLGICLRKAGELSEAATLLRQSLKIILARQSSLATDEGKVTFLDSVSNVFDQLIDVHLEQARLRTGDYGDSLDVVEEARGQALLDLMNGRERTRPLEARSGTGHAHEPPPFSPVSQMAPAVPSYEDFNPAAQMAPSINVNFVPEEEFRNDATEPEVEDRALTTVETRHAEPDQFAGEASAESHAARAAPKPPPLTRLVFHIMEERTALLVVAADRSIHGQVSDLRREEVADLVTRVRRALGVDDAVQNFSRNMVVVNRQPSAARNHRALLRELYARLITPVEAALPAQGTPLVIEPHGALWLLPFAALLSPDDTWLADKWPLLFAPSWKTLRQIRFEPDYGNPASLKALLVGNPRMPKIHTPGGMEIELVQLPGAEEEVEGIAEQFPESQRTVKLGDNADRATILKLMSQHGILHFATHGIAYSDSPLDSCVVLAEAEGESLLTARDIMYQSLATDLVSLSACQTGLGKTSGEGMIGLSRAFLVAGARAVLVSLWNVSDMATAELMTAFYRSYLESDDKAVALQRAMRELRALSEFEHPSFWSPFVIVGAER